MPPPPQGIVPIIVPPISSPPFTYSLPAGLQVNSHPRCSPSALFDILTHVESGPVLKKNGQPKVHQSAPYKDQTAAFYEAQLVHYGLSPLKSKHAAKHALLAAFKGDKRALRVPAEFSKLEKNMAALFHRKNRLAVEERNLGLGGSGPPNVKGGGKRKIEATGTHGDNPLTKKKTKVGKSAISVPPKPEKTVQSTGAPPDQRAVKKELVSPTVAKQTPVNMDIISSTTPKRTAAKKETVSGTTRISATRKEMMSNTPTGQTKTASSTANSERPVKKESVDINDVKSVKKRAPSKQGTQLPPDTSAGNQALKQEQGLPEEMKPAKNLKPSPLHKLSGRYIISAPELTNEWPSDVLTLSLAPSSTNSHLWGSFDFGVVEGTLRSSCRPRTSNTLLFHWRGRETGEGESTYGPDNIGEITFLPRGRIVGKMYFNGLGEFGFTGTFDKAGSQNKVFQKSVPRWKRSYWELNDGNYEQERVGRWGSSWGCAYGDDEPESNSDTGDERNGYENYSESEGCY